MVTRYLVQSEAEYVNYIQSLLPTKKYDEKMLRNHWDYPTTNHENGHPKLYATWYVSQSGNRELTFRRTDGGVILEYKEKKSLHENLITVLRVKVVYWIRRIKDVFLVR